jgi:NAD(P)H-dependent flavin oxidoreductase YrpB (nitropropane dioxygenase family)
MGGGLTTPELVAAVSGTGGLGTFGIVPPPVLAENLARAREISTGPVAVNLLLPFVRREHWEVAKGADLVVTFWGPPKRRTDRPWVHQCGSVDEALAARAGGADGVIVQGVEAGGHVRGTTPALDLLDQARAALPDGYPVWLAGGIAEGAQVAEGLAAGADAVVLGTRFLMSEESAAHAEYKRRLTDGSETILTDLFGFGWPASHRVLANDATQHWLARRGSDRVPGWTRLLHHAAVPAGRFVPQHLQARLTSGLRPSSPRLGPSPPNVGSPDGDIESTPLYAGQSVARIGDILPAAEIMRALAP